MIKAENVERSIAQGRLNNEEIDFDPDLSEILNASPPSIEDIGDNSSLIDQVQDNINNGERIASDVAAGIQNVKQTSDYSALAVGIAAEASDENLKADPYDEENNARGALKQILIGKIEASFIASQKTPSQLASVQSYLLYDIAYGLRHGSPKLFFRLFRGPVGEDGAWASIKSFAYNGITLFGKTHYTRPKQVTTDEDQTKLAEIISDSVETVCEKQL